MANSEWRIGNCNQAILLTGRRGVGKTTVCQAIADLARCRGYRPGGVITPALYDGHGVKVGFEALDVGSGERWPLARTDPSTLRLRSGQAGSGHRWELGGPRVGSYSFDPAALDRALKVLRRVAHTATVVGDKTRLKSLLRTSQSLPNRSRRITNPPRAKRKGDCSTNSELFTAGCDLFMIDEIGPLELEQGGGFAPILDLLPLEEKASPDAKTTHTLIVVRPALLDQLRLRLRGIECTVFSVTEENRDELPLRIVEELWGDA
jgi:nucleoside-triphosphatase THEP1